MSGRINWQRASSRDRMRSSGVESITGDDLLLRPPKWRPSKQELRAELAAALTERPVRVQCSCGHAGTVRVKPGARLRCSKCQTMIAL